jgi:hypothetical protein
LLENISDGIKNKFVMDKKYIERVEDFFEYHDKNNCKRVLEQIRLM